MNICVVGSGSIGKRHIKNIYALAVEMGKKVSIDLLRSSHFILPDEILSIINRQCFSKEELNIKYNAIFITNPTSLHYETLISLLDYSDNFFIEKPVFDKLNDDVSIFSRYPDKMFYVACPLRYTKVLLEAKEFVDNNKIYSVRAISSSYLPDWRKGVDYRTTYSAHKDMGGGVLIDLIHEWDYLMYFFGKPESIFKLYGKYSNLEIDSEDIAVYIARYKDKLLELHLDYCGRQIRRCCEFITPDGTFIFDIANNRILKNGEIIKNFEESVNDKYYEELKFFYDVSSGKKKNTNDIKHAMSVMGAALL